MKKEDAKFFNQDALDLLRSFPDNSIDFIITDPPYYITENIKIRRGNHMKYKGKDVELDIAEWDKNQWSDRNQYRSWLYDILQEFYRILKPEKHLIIFMDRSDASYYYDWWNEFGGKSRGFIFWKKTNPVPGARKVKFLNSIEMAFWGTKGKVRVKNFNWQLGMYTEVFEAAIPNAQGSAERHPTQKPLSIALKVIAYLSKPGDLVLDPFCGSGTFVVAAHLLNRRVIANDFTKKWVDIAKERLENSHRDEKVRRILKNFVEDILENRNRRFSEEDIIQLLFGTTNIDQEILNITRRNLFER